MTSFSSRTCDYLQDLEILMPFWLDWRAASDVRLYPTIWRIRLLLTSRVWDQVRDVRIWETESGQIVGFSMLWRRFSSSPYLALENYLRPLIPIDIILPEMLKWGAQRANEIAAEQNKSLKLYTSDYLQSSYSVKYLVQNGYSQLAPNPDEHNVYMERNLNNKITLPSLPPGYSIQQLRGLRDLESYQALYGFSYVNPLHRRELLESDEYCHLVVEGQRNNYLAYCECSINREEWKRTNQRIGWVDYIETKPDAQKRGFGKAVLFAGLSQLINLGAEIAMLVSVSTNTPALQLYKNASFVPVDVVEPPSYEKQIHVS
jgi:mycothiol synthase